MCRQVAVDRGFVAGVSHGTSGKLKRLSQCAAQAFVKDVRSARGLHAKWISVVAGAHFVGVAPRPIVWRGGQLWL